MASVPEDRKSSGERSRDQQLKAALRENLRRRKAQVRGRAIDPTAAAPREPLPSRKQRD